METPLVPIEVICCCKALCPLAARYLTLEGLVVFELMFPAIISQHVLISQ